MHNGFFYYFYSMSKLVKTTFAVLLLFFLFSCGEDKPVLPINLKTDVIDTLETKVEIDSTDVDTIISDYDFSKVDAKDRQEFKENLVKIEKKYGVQWDFCDCAVKSDSVNKAFMNVSDEEFDALMARSDFIDEKCQGFRAQSADRTPEDRAKHEAKIRKCLKEAGTK